MMDMAPQRKRLKFFNKETCDIIYLCVERSKTFKHTRTYSKVHLKVPEQATKPTDLTWLTAQLQDILSAFEKVHKVGPSDLVGLTIECPELPNRQLWLPFRKHCELSVDCIL